VKPATRLLRFSVDSARLLSEYAVVPTFGLIRHRCRCLNESMSRFIRLQVTPEDVGTRLDQFLASRFGAFSRMRIANLIGSGAALVNAGPARPGLRLGGQDMVEVLIGEAPPTSMTPEARPLEIVYEDDEILVVVKPANILVHPTRGVKRGTLANALVYHLNRAYYVAERLEVMDPDAGVEPEAGAGASPNGRDVHLRPAPGHGEPHSLIRPGIVHRLDRATSGLMVIAKSQRALRILSSHFRRRLVEKRYLAVVHGTVVRDVGSIIASIGRDPNRDPKWRVMDNGRSAETRYAVRERMTGVTLLELEPVTGRTNQLRIHCAYISHPILGDELYSRGSQERIDGEPDRSAEVVAEYSSGLSADLSCSRLCLHACRLAFHHPSGGRWMEFESVLPDEVERVLRTERTR
jgi:23S rRNA pseudouridine1911/1915/1917 synthase